MSDDAFNPYQTPNSDLVIDRDEAGLEHADRIQRLSAVVLDTLIRFVLVMPAFWFSGYIDRSMTEQTSTMEEVVWTCVAVMLFLASQVYPLRHWGQTWGKRIVGIRIVNLDGSNPDLWTLLGTRYGLFEFAVQVPLIGGLLAVVDSLMIFRADRRCLHDLVAGTRVVKGNPVPRAAS